MLIQLLACLQHKEGLELRSKWPFTEWETGPTQKSRENGKENGKWPQAQHGQKMAAEMEKWAQNGILAIFWLFFHFGGHFLAISGLGPFFIFFPIFSGFLCRACFPFCIWPLRLQDLSSNFGGVVSQEIGPKNVYELNESLILSDSQRTPPY